MLWSELFILISKNPKEITSLDVDAIMRSALRRYTDQIGTLWTGLADYYVRSGLFERVSPQKYNKLQATDSLHRHTHPTNTT